MLSKFEELKQDIQNSRLSAIKDHLLSSPELLTFRNENGDTALMVASRLHHIHHKPSDLLGAVSGDTPTVAISSSQYMRNKFSDTMANSVRDYIPVIRTIINTCVEHNANSALETALIEATTRGYTETVKELINAHIDINVCDTQKNTALIIAARNGELDIVRELIKEKANSNLQNTDDETALMLAAQNGHCDIVKELIDAYGAHLEAEDLRDALMIGIFNGDLDVVKTLLHEKTKLNEHTLSVLFNFALHEGHLHIVNELINSSVKLTLEIQEEIKTTLDFTDLHFAVWMGDISTVKRLIADGADLELADKQGKTALMLAADGNHADIISDLLAAGANNPYIDIEDPAQIKKDFQTIDNRTLWTLVERGHYDFNPHRHVKIWLSNNPDVFMNDENQLRLVKMRADCPGDEINLVYDSQLLSEASRLKLLSFCSKNNIQPINVRNLIPECLENNEEKQLINIYEDEISHLHEGGNLAAASDILRWLRPVIRKGIYSDFDVQVKTKGLPQKLEVFEEIIVPIGSHKTTNNTISLLNKNNTEALLVNNDVIAVLNPESEKLKIIQQHIINSCQPKTVVDNISIAISDSETLIEEFNKIITPEFVDKFPQKMTPREFRGNIKSIVEKFIPDDAIEVSEEIKDKEMQRLEKKLYLKSVISSTGPSSVMSLFQEPSPGATPEYIDSHVAAFALNSYPSISKAFASTQACVLHAENKIEAYKDCTGGDMSWTNEGETNIQSREKTLHTNATKIQTAYRDSIVRMRNDSKNTNDTNDQSGFKIK